MSEAPATNAPSISDALAKLSEAMRSSGAGTTDAARKRAAAMLSELMRTDDEDLLRFAKRHLAGRAVDEETMKSLRELALGLARLVFVMGKGRGEEEVLQDVRAALLDRLEELESDKPIEPRAAKPKIAPNAEVALPAPAPVPEAPRPAYAIDNEETIPNAEPPDATAVNASGLPFSPSPAAPTPATPERVVSRAARFEETLAPPERPRKDTLPFQKSAALPKHLANMDLETYATFTALLTVYQEHAAQICSQYGVRDTAERDLLDRHWLTVFGANPELGAEWIRRRDEALSRYRRGR
ncbi:MAG: hypothetical protein U0271_06050 [Polyangiaceae bacterium]